MQARVTKDDEQQPILLCCAGPDRSSIAPVVEKASHLGRAWLVCGIEINTKRLERGIERYGTTALYVLCRSQHLDAEKVGALQRLLRARGIPAPRIMVVDVKAGETSKVEGALEQRMARPHKPIQRGGAIPPPPKVARVAPPAPARPKPSVPAKAQVQPANASRSRAPTRKMAPVPALKSSTPSPDLGVAVRSPRPLGKVTLVSTGREAPVLGARAKPPSAPAPAPSASPAASVEPKIETRQKTDSIPVAPTGPEPVAARSMIAALPSRRPPRWLLASAAAALVIGLGGMGIALAGGEEEAGTVAASQQVDETVQDAPVEAAPVQEAAPEAKTPARVEQPAPVVAAAEAPAPTQPAEVTPPIEADDADPEAAYELELQGLRTRQLREVDGIVFTAQVLDRDIHFLRAEAYCRNLTLSGISDWRLPTAAELGTIGTVVDLGRTPLWTSTDGDAKAKSMLVYRDEKDEFAVHGRTWRGARALCVRASSDA